MVKDPISQVNFNDGEVIEENDLNRLQSLLFHKIIERSGRLGCLGGSQSFGHQTGGNGPFSPGGAEMGQRGATFQALSSSSIYTPDPLGFVLEDFSINQSGFLNFSYGDQILVQRSNRDTPGTPPPGFGRVLSVAIADGEVGFGNIANPLVRPRIDSIGFRLGHGQSNIENRDIVGPSGILTNANVNKNQDIVLESELVQGDELDSPVAPTHTTGFNRFITMRRIIGESNVQPSDVQLHSFPMQLKTETVWGRDMGHRVGAWDSGGQAGMGIRKKEDGGDTLLVIPRNMNEGCRLVGIGLGFGRPLGNDVDIHIISYELNGSGNAQINVFEDIGSGNPLSTSGGGFMFAGLPDFASPYWGNGRTYGPLLSRLSESSEAHSLIFTQIGLSLGLTTDWTDGKEIHFVRFYYLE